MIDFLVRNYNVFDIFVTSFKNSFGTVENCMEILAAFIGIVRMFNFM